MAHNAGSFAYLALLLVVPLTITAFATLRPVVATLVVYLGSVMFGPMLVDFDAPLVPPLDKESLPNLMIFICVCVTARREMKAARMGTGLDILVLGLVFCAAGTALTNTDLLQYGPTSLPGMATGDILSEGIRLFLLPVIPFLVARTLFRSTDDCKTLLKGLAIAGLLYTPFIVIEMRMSPQFHAWVYGFHQHDFSQTRREGGFRPMVFMAHGLAVAMLVLTSVIATITLAKAKVKYVKLPRMVPPLIQISILATIKSMGAFIYGCVAIPFAWFLKPKTQIRIAVFLACIAGFYPLLRATGLFPREQLVEWAASIEQDRARSLEFRFSNEDDLINKMLDRPLFGWGGFSRGHVFDPGQRRGHLGRGRRRGLGAQPQRDHRLHRHLRLAALPGDRRARRVGKLSPQDQPLLAGVALISTFYTLDLLPNGFFNQIPFFLAGALMGLSQGMSSQPAVRPEVARLQQALALLQQANLRARRGQPVPRASLQALRVRVDRSGRSCRRRRPVRSRSRAVRLVRSRRRSSRIATMMIPTKSPRPTPINVRFTRALRAARPTRRAARSPRSERARRCARART